jgi:putative DNA primase/helicase
VKPDERQRVALQSFKDIADTGSVITDPRQAGVPLPTTGLPSVTSTQLSSLRVKENRWLWPGYIPHAALTLVIGDPGLGKSQLTLDVAARVTNGMMWPDGSGHEPDISNVLLLASEDSIERTVMPRLEACGAVLDRIVVLNEVTIGSKRRMFDLKTDIDILEEFIASNHIELVILDPLNGYIGNTNSWKESEVRSVLMPVRAIADRHDVAVIGVIHLNKDNTRAAIHRAQGSVAFTAVARAVFAVAPHQKYQGLRYFVSVKQNYAQQPQTLGFTLAPGGGVVWDGQMYPAVTADSLLAIVGAPEEKEERRTARSWLAATLENGPIKTADLVKMAHDSAISDRALQRAKYDLKVISQRHAQPGKLGGGFWEWRLP